MIRQIRGFEMAKSIAKSSRIVVKSFSGATTNNIKHYIIPTKEMSTERIIIHTGTNDLKSSMSADKISNNIVKVALVKVVNIA